MAYLRLALAAACPAVVTAVLYLWNGKSAPAARKSWGRQILFGLIFGAMSVIGSEFGVPIDGAIINVRDAAPLCAGLIFGPPAGIIAGVIGGLERWFAVLWGAGSYTRLACSVSTALAGCFAAVLRKWMFDNKTPSWQYGFAIGVITEVFHMLMVFFTNMADVRMAFGFVRLCAGPMILANGCAVMCAVALVALLSRRERKPLDREHRQLTQSFSRWLSAVVLVAFCATSVFTWFLQTSWAEDSNRQLLTLNLDDVKQDILDASDANLLELTRGVAADLDAAKTVNGGTLAAICRKPGNDFSEINVVDENGIIMSSTTLSYRGFDMASGEQSSEFLALLDGVQEYVQSYQPVSKDGETYMKYAAVALERGGFVQVGYNAARFRRDIDQRVVGATKNRHVGENGYLIQSWMRSSTTVEYLRMWEKTYNPKFQDNACDELIHTVHTTGTTLTPSLWIQSTHAKGIKTSRGKGGGTIAHPESAEMFRAWLFPEFMLDLVQWYRTFHHKDKI